MQQNRPNLAGIRLFRILYYTSNIPVLPMELAFNLLLILLIEIPVVGFFFSKRRRKNAYLVGLFVNVVTWPIVNIIRLNTNWDLNWVQVGVVVLEGALFWLLLGRNLKKAALISILANLASFLITKVVYLPPDFFQKKTNIIR